MSYIDLLDTQQSFSKEMQDRLAEKEEEGFVGWDDEMYGDLIVYKLNSAVRNGKWVDVANFAMMLRRFQVIHEEECMEAALEDQIRETAE